MPYRFKINQPVADNVRRIVKEEIGSAISHLSLSDSKQRDKNIHEARKSIKRLRALLRLVRPELGSWFHKENVALRDVGRRLSDLRDASIVLETFDSLSPAASGRKELQPARTQLQLQKKANSDSADLAGVLHQAAESLRLIGERVKEWPLSADGFEAISKGLKAEYRDGRRFMTAALKKDDPLLFHEWRKRAKCQLFHLRLLRSILTEPLLRQEQLLHRLETALGDDHNLLILRQHLSAAPKELGGRKVVERSLDLVSEREKTLRTEAAALAKQIYQQRPKEFLAELRTAWQKAEVLPMQPPLARSTAA